MDLVNRIVVFNPKFPQIREDFQHNLRHKDKSPINLDGDHGLAAYGHVCEVGKCGGGRREAGDFHSVTNGIGGW